MRIESKSVSAVGSVRGSAPRQARVMSRKGMNNVAGGDIRSLAESVRRRLMSLRSGAAECCYRSIRRSHQLGSNHRWPFLEARGHSDAICDSSSGAVDSIEVINRGCQANAERQKLMWKSAARALIPSERVPQDRRLRLSAPLSR